MVKKEWECFAHGYFDSAEQKCPHGCHESMVQRVFRTPVSIRSPGYSAINQSFESLAAEHGLTDMSNRSGEGMRKADWKTHQRMDRRMEMMGHGDLSGQDLSQFFKPLSEMGNLGPQPGALRKDAETGRVMAGDFTLATPQVKVAGVYDGSKAGLPAGDA